IGWNPSTHSSKEIGSLHLAVKGDDGELHYAGKVGTGFSFKQRIWFKEQLEKDVIPKPPAKDAPRVKVATWVRPRFVVQVAFTEWTGDNRLRHPSFLGIREDKGVDEVVREKPVPAGGERRAASGKKKTQSSVNAVSASSEQRAASRKETSQDSGLSEQRAASRKGTPKDSALSTQHSALVKLTNADRPREK